MTLRYFVFFAFFILVVVACDNLIEDDPNPFAPTPQQPKITPVNTVVSTGGTVTFTATSTIDPVSWSVNNTALATIDSSSGALTAGTTAGTVVVTAMDANAKTATATVTITSATGQQTLVVSPASSVVTQGATITFAVANATTPVSWSVSDTRLASINVSTGAFTAGTLPGSVTVTARDDNGNTATATVTVIMETILITPSSMTFMVLPTLQPDFNATGNVRTVTFVMTGATGGYTGATINSATGQVTITAMPTALEGNQTLTVTAEDGVATPDTATLTLMAQ